MSADPGGRTTEEQLAGEIAGMLASILALPAIATTDDFFLVGGDSLAAMELMVGIEARFGLVIEPAEIFDRPLLSDFAAYVASLEESA